jgi:hypothetical protein
VTSSFVSMLVYFMPPLFSSGLKWRR